MIRVLLIRHGSTDLMQHTLCGRMAGVRLNAAGVMEAQAAARMLRSAGELKAVYASPLERAQETAAFIAEPHHLPVQTLDAFNEVDFGAWTGQRIQDLKSRAEWQEFNHFRSMTTPPSGESMIAIQARAYPALLALEKRHASGTIAVVSHGDVIRGLLLYLLGMPIDNIFRLEIAPASISFVSIAGGLAPVVHCINVNPGNTIS